MCFGKLDSTIKIHFKNYSAHNKTLAKLIFLKSNYICIEFIKD